VTRDRAVIPGVQIRRDRLEPEALRPFKPELPATAPRRYWQTDTVGSEVTAHGLNGRGLIPDGDFSVGHHCVQTRSASTPAMHLAPDNAAGA
jgi:hypothetical protein